MVTVRGIFLDVLSHENSWFGVQADFIEQLIQARFVQEQLTSSGYTSSRWQVSSQ
jgi:hypothetical protein